MLIGLVPGAEQSQLWLLYLLVIILLSKHEKTIAVFLMLGQVYAALCYIRALSTGFAIPASEYVARNSDLLQQFALLGLLTFILHYLVRNIQARNETIAGYAAVHELLRDVNMEGDDWSNHWSPLLKTLLQYLGADAVAAWSVDLRLRHLRLIAAARRSIDQPLNNDFISGDDDKTISLDGEDPIAQVARSGEFRHMPALQQLDGEPHSINYGKCQPARAIAHELFAPISMGKHARFPTLGLIVIGFSNMESKERLRDSYKNLSN